MTIEIIAFVFGGFLLFISIVGGGLEIRELKVPRIGAGPRVSAFAAGVVFIVVGVALPNLAHLAPRIEPKTQPATSSSVEFAVHDHLGPRQVDEQLSVFISGKRVGNLSVNQHSPNAALNVKLPAPGQYSYELRTVTLVAVNGAVRSVPGTGQGTIYVEKGKDFDVRGKFTGSGFLLELDPREIVESEVAVKMVTVEEG